MDQQISRDLEQKAAILRADARVHEATAEGYEQAARDARALAGGLRAKAATLTEAVDLMRAPAAKGDET